MRPGVPVVPPCPPDLVDGSGRPVDPLVHLVLFVEDALVAVPFDRRRLRATGPAVPVYWRVPPAVVDSALMMMASGAASITRPAGPHPESRDDGDVHLAPRGRTREADTGPMSVIPRNDTAAAG